MTIKSAIAIILTGAALSGCAAGGGVSMASLTAPPKGAVATGSLPDLATLGNTPTLDGSVTDVYSRIAAKALTCWFSTDGPLKGTHVFSAEAPPPSSGGSAEITIFEKDTSAANPRGIRAYRMSLTRESDIATRLTLQAGKLPPDLAQAMEKDVLAWGLSKDSCEARAARPPPPPPPPVAEKKPQKKKRVSANAAQTSSPAVAPNAPTALVSVVAPAGPGPTGQASSKPAAQPR